MATAFAANPSRTRLGKRLRALLDTAAQSMLPIDLQAARFGRRDDVELLQPSTRLPVDKDSGSALLTISWPNQDALQPPYLEASIHQAVTDLIEEWRGQDLLRAVNLEPRCSCLFYGPPGTGKTHLALSLGRSLQLPVAIAKLDSIISSYLGTTARNIANVFSFVDRYNCILLLDEFDAIAKLRDDPQELGEIKRVVNSLLQSIDTRNTRRQLTFATTNHAQLLDPAVWRRFEVQIQLSKPSEDVRLALLRDAMKPLPIEAAQLKIFAWLTHGRSGADVVHFATAFKRTVALQPDRSTIDVLRGYAAANSERVPDSLNEILLSSDRALARHLATLRTPRIDQSEIARLFGRDKATISRWVRASGAQN
ncbi:MAG TPA: AAA family ATPase [Candidatus Elarobacter sp.]|nr:AAA family ATPase [Candidatus Elarobacter sp.]